MLRKVIVTGGKGLSNAQLKEIENDVNESQQRMLDAHKDQREAVQRTTYALEDEIKKIDAEPVIKDEHTEAKRNDKLAELQTILSEFQ